MGQSFPKGRIRWVEAAEHEVWVRIVDLEQEYDPIDITL